MQELFTERSTVLVGVLVGFIVLMRLVLQFVPPQSVLSRFILWFWHPEARALPKVPVERTEKVYSLYHQTLPNMDSTLVALALVFFVIRPLVVQAFFIPSASMEPTLMGNEVTKDRVLVNRYLYHVREPKRQEIIVFHAPAAALQNPDNPQDFIKRVMGIPGDTLEVRNHHVWINGRQLSEPYLDENRIDRGSLFCSPEATNFGPIKVPPHKYFMMGDNRTNSHDSRLWRNHDTGQHEPFIDRSAILGKAMCVFWPLPGVRLLRTPGND